MSDVIDACAPMSRERWAKLWRRSSMCLACMLTTVVAATTQVVSQQGRVGTCRSAIEIRGVAFDREYLVPMTIERVWNNSHEYSVTLRDYASLMSVSSLTSELRSILDSSVIMPARYPYRRGGAYVVIVAHDSSCAWDTIVIEPGQILYRGNEYIPNVSFIQRISELIPAVFGKDMREEFERIRAIRRE